MTEENKTLYSYRCKRCRHVQDEMRDKKERNEVGVCSECGGPALRLFLPKTVLFAWSRAMASPNDN